MSADNGYVIRKHPAGGYAAVMYFDSSLEDQGWPDVRPDHHHPFGTFLEAYRYAEREYSEYGVSIHPEIKIEGNEAMDETATQGTTDETYDQKAMKTLEKLLASPDANVQFEAAREILRYTRY